MTDSAGHSTPTNLAPAFADAEIARDHLADGAPIAVVDLGPENCRWPPQISNSVGGESWEAAPIALNMLPSLSNALDARNLNVSAERGRRCSALSFEGWQ
jgi:hypothetical protein